MARSSTCLRRRKASPQSIGRAWDGSGNAEQLFQYTPGAFITLTDWSPDGKFMTFTTGVLVLVPAGDQKPTERKAIDWLREEYNALTGRFSPDMRFMAYLSDQAQNGKLEIYVRPFDAGKPESPPPGAIVQVSNHAVGIIGWRGDGREMYFIQPDSQNTDVHVMAVDVTTTPTFQAGAPRLLFKVQGPLPGNSIQWKSASSDGQRFVFAINVPQTTPAR
jgi:Tol biopolymer transport system component